jgi:hypothetical protein
MLTVTHPRVVPGIDSILHRWLRRNAWLIVGLASWAAALILISASVDPAWRQFGNDTCEVSF